MAKKKEKKPKGKRIKVSRARKKPKASKKKGRKGQGQYSSFFPTNRQIDSNQYWQLRAEIAGAEARVRSSLKDKKDEESKAEKRAEAKVEKLEKQVKAVQQAQTPGTPPQPQQPVNVTINNTVENTSEGTFKRADRHGVTSSTTGTGTVTLQAGSSAVKRVFVMSGVDGTILGEVNAPKISNRSDVSFTFSVGASIENYLYIEKTDRSPCVYRVTYTAA